MDLVTTLKRSRTLHSTYSLGRRFRQVQLSEWTRARRTVDIFRVLPNTMVSIPRLINAYDAVETVDREHLEGALVECGVWAGGTAGLMACANARGGNSVRTVHLFDSFEGLPQPSAHDADVLEPFHAAHPDLALDDGANPVALTAIGACSAPLEQVHKLFFDVLDVDPRRVVIHQGWFQDTVPAAAETIGPIAVLRLDGDWYESTKTCLEGLYDNVVEDGFVLIDDYGEFVGCARAVDEFLESHGVDVTLVKIDREGVYFRKPAAV